MPASVEFKGQRITAAHWQEFVAGFAPITEEQPGRRGEQRHRLRGTVRVKYKQNGAPHMADLEVADVSAGGITARHWLPISRDTMLEMQIMLDEVTLLVSGKVVHCTNMPGGHNIGIQFLFEAAK